MRVLNFMYTYTKYSTDFSQSAYVAETFAILLTFFLIFFISTINDF